MIGIQLFLLAVFSVTLLILFLNIFKKKDEPPENMEQDAEPALPEEQLPVEIKPESDMLDDLLTTLDAKYTEIDEVLETIKNREDPSAGKEIEQLTQYISQIESTTLQKGGLNGEQSEILAAISKKIIDRLDEYEIWVTRNRQLASQEKQSLQSRLSDLKAAASAEVKDFDSRIQELKDILTELKEHDYLPDPVPETVKENPVEELVSVLDANFREISSKIENIRDSRELSTVDFDILRKEIENVENNILRNISFKQEQREQLSTAIRNIINRIQLHEKQLLEDQSGYLKEKNSLTARLADIKASGEKEIFTYDMQVQNLKNVLSKVRDSGVEGKVKSLEEEILSTTVLMNRMKEQSDDQTVFQREKLVEKDKEFAKMQAELPTIITLTETQKLKQLEELKQKNSALENEIGELKEKVNAENLSVAGAKAKLEEETNRINGEIAAVEEESTRLEHFLSYKKRLEKEINELSERMKLREQRFLQECKSRDEEIRKLSASIDSKANTIKEKWAQQEQALLAEQKQLGDTIKLLKNQAESIKSSGDHTANELKKEIKRLTGLLKEKKDAAEDIKKLRIQTEELIKKTVGVEIKNLKVKFDKQSAEYAEKIKQKDNELYTLKTRLSIREDKLRMDMEKRKTLLEKMLEKSRHEEDYLRADIDQNMIKAEEKASPYKKEISRLNEALEKSEKNIVEEEKTVKKIEQDRIVLEKEISSLEDDLGKALKDIEKKITLKNKQIELLGKEILAKENLIKSEHIEGQKLVNMDMLQARENKKDT
jgi:chromosome segregation ATPase